MQTAVHLHTFYKHQTMRSTGSTSVAALLGRFEQRAVTDKMRKATCIQM